MNIQALLASVLLSVFTVSQTSAQEAAPAPAPGNQVITVNVLGMVNKPSRLTLPSGSTILDALASAGGPTKEAILSKVKVIHRTKAETPDVSVVDVRAILDGARTASVLRDGDTLYVPERVF